MGLNLSEVVHAARQGARLACDIMMAHYRGDYAVSEKAGAADRAEAVVTEPDYLCDRALVRFFSERFPDHAVVSEESAGELPPGWHESRWIWFIDPIDGSLSYAEGTDNFGVSIALARDGEPVLGALSNPARDLHAWAAIDGERAEAFLNGGAARLGGECPDPPRLILSSNQAARRSYRKSIGLLRPAEVLTWESVVTKAIYLLAGAGDLYFSLPHSVFGGGCPKKWDVAAAAAVVRAAGGIATNAFGEPIDLGGPELRWHQGIVLAHPGVTQKSLDTLAQVIEERRASPLL